MTLWVRAVQDKAKAPGRLDGAWQVGEKARGQQGWEGKARSRDEMEEHEQRDP